MLASSCSTKISKLPPGSHAAAAAMLVEWQHTENLAHAHISAAAHDEEGGHARPLRRDQVEKGMEQASCVTSSLTDVFLSPPLCTLQFI